jgi:hypothetical protein
MNIIKDFFSGVHITSSDKSKIAEVAARTDGVLALPVSPGLQDILKGLVTIDFGHHMIHAGESFDWFYYGACNNTSKDVRLVVPNVATTKTPHLVWEVMADASAFIYLYEAVTWTAAGVEAATFNKNRNSATASGMKLYITGGTVLTVNSTGTQIAFGWLSAGKITSGSGDRTLDERVLKANTEYLFRVTTGGNANIMIRLHWYED